MNSRVEKFDCIKKEDLVAYLYNEMPGRELSLFETHLADCQACIDEFAELSASRYAVYEWQKLEFAPMETPVFDVPRHEVTAQKAGWLEGLRELLSFRPAMAAAGSFAALVIAALLGYSIFVGPDGAKDMAAAETGDAAVAEITTISPPRPQMDVPTTGAPVDNSGSDRSTGRISEPAFASSPERHSGTSYRPAKTRRRAPAPQTAVSARTSYRLNDVDDTSDDGLRLADLLDEV